jgi:hypothetical protein
MATAEDVVSSWEALPDDEKLKANAAIAVRPLPQAPTGVVGTLWIMVVGTLCIVLIAGGVGLYFLSRDNISTEVLLPIVTSALTALVGLLAPSPVASQ